LPIDTPKPTYKQQAKSLTEAKKVNPDLKAVNAQVLQQVLMQLDKAFTNMWERGFGFPRFKKRGRMRSFVFPQLGVNPLQGDALKLPVIGWVSVRVSRPIPDGFELKQARIVKKASGYFVMLCLQGDVQVPDVMPHGHPVGIDLGLNTFAATSDGELIARPRFFVDLQSELKLLQRRLKHKRKGSSNWRKLTQKISRLHQRINDTRKDYHFKTAHRICNNVGMIFAEDLNLKAMSSGMLCKQTLDAGFGQFLSILSWVCWKRGVYFALVDPNGTSQTCPKCDAHVAKDLSVRIHECPECKYVTSRDVASAQVILNRGVNAAGQAVSKLPAEGMCLGHPMKQEISEATLGIPHHTA
jgi:putative transposase